MVENLLFRGDQRHIVWDLKSFPASFSLLGTFLFNIFSTQFWLVVWNNNLIFPYIGTVMIPTDSYFSEGRLNHRPDDLSHVFDMCWNHQTTWLSRENSNIFFHPSGDARKSQGGVKGGAALKNGFLQKIQPSKNVIFQWIGLPHI